MITLHDLFPGRPLDGTVIYQPVYTIVSVRQAPQNFSQWFQVHWSKFSRKICSNHRIHSTVYIYSFLSTRLDCCYDVKLCERLTSAALHCSIIVSKILPSVIICTNCPRFTHTFVHNSDAGVFNRRTKTFVYRPQREWDGISEKCVSKLSLHKNAESAKKI